jgi:lipopolysaccharide transport system permease protein
VTPLRYPVGLSDLFGTVVDYTSLLWQFSRREVSGRYRGSLLGFGWAILNPLLLLAIYTFVFSVVFRIRWDGPVTDRGGFALVVYTGMIVHGFFAECMTRAPALIVDNRNLVKKVVFPLQLLPWSVLVVATFHFAVGVVLIALATLVFHGTLPVTIVALPVLFVPLALMSLGVVYALCALGVYLRDVGQVVGFLAMTLLFLSPVFYPASAVPDGWRWVIALNPIATFIEATRGALLYGAWPAPATLAAMWCLGLAAAWLGFYGFQRTRRGFADVL